MVDVHELTIAQAHDAFQKGTYSSRDLTSAYLDRIQTLDKNGARIYSTLAISTTALNEAAALDAYYNEHSKFKGRPHGIPVLVKDQADTNGMETLYGSHMARGNIPAEEAFVVTKLKEEGAIILGKTTMSEKASTWFSATSATNWEFTHNPYKMGFDVGGSSSGSAAAVAANFAMLAVADDTGGSIRCPAINNLIGIRVTPGLISRSGFCPLIATQDTPDDFTGINLINDSPKSFSYAINLNPSAIKSAKIGIVRQLFGPDSDPYCKAVNKVSNSAIALLAYEGTTFVEVEVPNLKHYMSFTPTYLQRSRSDINAFLTTKPHLPQDIAEIIPTEPEKMFLDFTSMMAHGPLNPNDDPTYVQKLLERDQFHRTLLTLMSEQNWKPSVSPIAKYRAPKHDDATNGRFPTCWDFPVNTLSSQPIATASIYGACRLH